MLYIQLSLPKEPPEFGLVEVCIGGWSSACQPYIESAAALSDYEFIARNDGFWRALEIDFRCETKATKVMVDLKLDALYR